MLNRTAMSGFKKYIRFIVSLLAVDVDVRRLAAILSGRCYDPHKFDAGG